MAQRSARTRGRGKIEALEEDSGGQNKGNGLKVTSMARCNPAMLWIYVRTLADRLLLPLGEPMITGNHGGSEHGNLKTVQLLVHIRHANANW